MADGVVLNDYLTCYTKAFFVPRGNSKANYYVCNTCGAMSLNTGGQRHQYVLRKDLTDASVYQSASTWLYLREELVEQIDWSPWPDANLDEVRVIEKPYDSHTLAGDPDWGQEKQMS